MAFFPFALLLQKKKKKKKKKEGLFTHTQFLTEYLSLLPERGFPARLPTGCGHETHIAPLFLLGNPLTLSLCTHAAPKLTFLFLLKKTAKVTAAAAAALALLPSCFSLSLVCGHPAVTARPPSARPSPPVRPHIKDSPC